jgi:hypothetical protein
MVGVIGLAIVVVGNDLIFINATMHFFPSA